MILIIYVGYSEIHLISKYNCTESEMDLHFRRPDIQMKFVWIHCFLSMCQPNAASFETTIFRTRFPFLLGVETRIAVKLMWTHCPQIVDCGITM